MRLLEEFWYGNIEPTDYDISSCKEYKKLQELICRNEEKLRATMTDEQKELFEKYTDCVREHQTITDCLIFQNSFKLKKVEIPLPPMEEQERIAQKYQATLDEIAVIKLRLEKAVNKLHHIFDEESE